MHTLKLPENNELDESDRIQMISEDPLRCNCGNLCDIKTPGHTTVLAPIHAPSSTCIAAFLYDIEDMV